ncbi:MAG TPA: hypothetical protein VIF57_17605 [Polyangia bacterium]
MNTAAILGPLALAACAGQRQGSAAAIPDGDTTVVRIVVAGRLCDPGAPVDPDLTANVRSEAPTLAQRFGDLHLVVPPPIDDPAANDLERAVAPEGHHPLIVIYSGHGQLADLDGTVLSKQQHLAPPRRPLRSVLCLRDGPLPLDDVVRGFRAPTPAALFIANACYTAHVDLRGVPADVSVVAGSTRAIAASTETPIARELAGLLSLPLDCDDDGQVSDFELFAPLERRFRRGGGAPDPKLLRQLRGRPAFFRSTRGSCPVAAPPLDAPSTPSFPGGREHARFPGRVPDPWPAQFPVRGFPDPCPDAVGQCFDVSSRPPS